MSGFSLATSSCPARQQGGSAIRDQKRQDRSYRPCTKAQRSNALADDQLCKLGAPASSSPLTPELIRMSSIHCAVMCGTPKFSKIPRGLVCC